MLTVLALICGFLVIAFVVAVVTGIIAVAPILLVIVGLLMLDYFIFRMIFRRKK